MATTTASSGNNTAVILLAVLLIAVVAAALVYMMQDHRSASQRVGDAVEALPQGPAKAVDKLGDQPPAVNLKDNASSAVKKAS